MAEYNADIIIFGAGIAGLWAFQRLKRMEYNVLLLEKEAIGSGQTIASQGIIHSGRKYKLGGRKSALAENMRAMPDLWRKTLGNSCVAAPSQNLLIPKGIIGAVLKKAVLKSLDSTKPLPTHAWPAHLASSGFGGTAIDLEEPVLNIPDVLKTLARPFQDAIRKVENPSFHQNNTGSITSVQCGDHSINAKIYIFAAAGRNHAIAKQLRHDAGLQTQVRPLLMGMIKHAPFPLYAHFISPSEKPLMSITAHKTSDGALVWYAGGLAAERVKESDPQDVYKFMKQSFRKFLPKLDLSRAEWATHPVDRVEGKAQGIWIPDTPTLHHVANALYCWPTKLAFAPLLTHMIVERLKKENITPSDTQSDWAFLPEAPFAEPPWEKAAWTR